MPRITFENEGVSAEIAEGQTLWHAAQKAGVVLQRGFSALHPCGGKGLCRGSACAVWLRAPDPAAAVSPPTWKERLLHRGLLRSRQRLACQCVPKRDLAVVTI